MKCSMFHHGLLCCCCSLSPNFTWHIFLHSLHFNSVCYFCNAAVQPPLAILLGAPPASPGAPSIPHWVLHRSLMALLKGLRVGVKSLILNVVTVTAFDTVIALKRLRKIWCENISGEIQRPWRHPVTLSIPCPACSAVLRHHEAFTLRFLFIWLLLPAAVLSIWVCIEKTACFFQKGAVEILPTGGRPSRFGSTGDKGPEEAILWES